jgi:DnaK suppressor protein
VKGQTHLGAAAEPKEVLPPAGRGGPRHLFANDVARTGSGGEKSRDHPRLTGRSRGLNLPVLFKESPSRASGREGKRLNKKDLKRFKTMLEESKRQLLLSARKTLTEESSFDTDDLPDEIDLASSEYSQSMIFRLRDREKFLLAKIDKALARIESGGFGICEKCEEEISMKRLEARPVTTLCIRCKEEQEQKEKSFG